MDIYRSVEKVVSDSFDLLKGENGEGNGRGIYYKGIGELDFNRIWFYLEKGLNDLEVTNSLKINCEKDGESYYVYMGDLDKRVKERKKAFDKGKKPEFSFFIFDFSGSPKIILFDEDSSICD